jgi:hypothetical protein
MRGQYQFGIVLEVYRGYEIRTAKTPSARYARQCGPIWAVTTRQYHNENPLLKFKDTTTIKKAIDAKIKLLEHNRKINEKFKNRERLKND